MIYKFKASNSDLSFDFDIELEKNNKIYCFIGKNGIGKTQLLENMAKSLVFAHSIFVEHSKYKYQKIFFEKSVFEALNDFEIKLPINVEINNKKLKNENDAYSNWTHRSFKEISKHYSKSFYFDKPIVFIGAKNRGYTKNINTDNIKILPNSQKQFVESIIRTINYINGKGLENKEIADWFIARLIVNPKFIISKQDKRNEVLVVLKLMQKLGVDFGVDSEDENSILEKVLFDDGKLLFNGIPIDKLSTGFVAIIKIFQEIVAAYGAWNLDETDLSKISGVVFIDEIEPHLHISWQTKILNILKNAFPNTIFYVSTHSPLVISGLKTGEVYELYQENNILKSKIIKDIDNYFLNDIIKDFFDIDLNKNKINSVDKHKATKARKSLSRLIEIIEES